MSRGQVTSPCQGRRWTRSNTCCALMVAGCLLSMIWFRVNIEPSVPLGVYRLHAVSEPLPRGTLVLLPVPGSVQRWHAPWLPLLKPIAAIAGEVVCVDEDVLTIGGSAGPFGKNLTFGGHNKNKALGFGSTADQQVVTVSP